MCFLPINKILIKKVSIVNNTNTIETLHNYVRKMAYQCKYYLLKN